MNKGTREGAETTPKIEVEKLTTDYGNLIREYDALMAEPVTPEHNQQLKLLKERGRELIEMLVNKYRILSGNNNITVAQTEKELGFNPDDHKRFLGPR